MSRNIQQSQRGSGRAPPAPAKIQKMGEVFPCKNRPADVNIEKSKLIYDQNEQSYERN